MITKIGLKNWKREFTRRREFKLKLKKTKKLKKLVRKKQNEIIFGGFFGKKMADAPTKENPVSQVIGKVADKIVEGPVGDWVTKGVAEGLNKSSLDVRGEAKKTLAGEKHDMAIPTPETTNRDLTPQEENWFMQLFQIPDNLLLIPQLVRTARVIAGTLGEDPDQESMRDTAAESLRKMFKDEGYKKLLRSEQFGEEQQKLLDDCLKRQELPLELGTELITAVARDIVEQQRLRTEQRSKSGRWSILPRDEISYEPYLSHPALDFGTTRLPTATPVPPRQDRRPTATVAPAPTATPTAEPPTDGEGRIINVKNEIKFNALNQAKNPPPPETPTAIPRRQRRHRHRHQNLRFKGILEEY